MKLTNSILKVIAICACIYLFSFVNRASSEPAADNAPLQLNWKFKQGDTAYYRVRVDSVSTTAAQGGSGTEPVEQKSRTEVLLRTNVESVQSDGKATVRLTFDAVKLDRQGVTPIKYDSVSDELSGAKGDEFSIIAAAIVGQSLQVDLSPKGMPSNVRGISELVDRLAGILGRFSLLTTMVQSMKVFVNPETDWSEFGLYLRVPEQPLVSGANWTEAVALAPVQKASPLIRSIENWNYSYKGLQKSSNSVLPTIVATASFAKVVETANGDAAANPALPKALAELLKNFKYEPLEQSDRVELTFDATLGRLSNSVRHTHSLMQMTVAGDGATTSSSQHKVGLDSTTSVEFVPLTEIPESVRKQETVAHKQSTGGQLAQLVEKRQTEKWDTREKEAQKLVQDGAQRLVAQGKLFYDSKPVAEINTEKPTFWFRSENVGGVVEPPVEYANGEFQIFNLKPGKYGMSVRVPRVAKNPASKGLSTFYQFDVVEGQVSKFDVDLQMAMHLLKPEDTDKHLSSSTSERDLPFYQGPLTFEWESVAAGATYIASIEEQNYLLALFGSRSIKEERTTETKITFDLPKSKPNTFYRFQLSAEKSGRDIGSLSVSTYGGSGPYYDFYLSDPATESSDERNARFSREHFVAGENLERKGDFQGALRAYGETEKLNPSYRRLTEKLAQLYLLTGQYDKAITYYRNAISSSPNDSSYLRENLGKALLRSDDSDAAIREFNQALAETESPHVARSLNLNLYRVYLKRKEFDLAEKYLRKAHEEKKATSPQSNLEQELKELQRLRDGGVPTNAANPTPGANLPTKSRSAAAFVADGHAFDDSLSEFAGHEDIDIRRVEFRAIEKRGEFLLRYRKALPANGGVSFWLDTDRSPSTGRRYWGDIGIDAILNISYPALEAKLVPSDWQGKIEGVTVRAEREGETLKVVVENWPYPQFDYVVMQNISKGDVVNLSYQWVDKPNRITVDGTADDWRDIKPQWTATAPAKPKEYAATDIRQVRVTNDERSLFLLVEFSDERGLFGDNDISDGGPFFGFRFGRSGKSYRYIQETGQVYSFGTGSDRQANPPSLTVKDGQKYLEVKFDDASLSGKLIELQIGGTLQKMDFLPDSARQHNGHLEIR